MRRLLVGLAAVLLVGAILDGTVQRAHGVYETLGQERPSWLVDETGPGLDQPTLVGSAERGRPETSRFSVYVALRDVAPGATIHVDHRIARQSLPLVHLVGVGGTRVAGAVGAEGVPVPDRNPERRGQYRGGDPWEIHLAGPDPIALLALPSGSGVALLDVRLLDEATVIALGLLEVGSERDPRSWARSRDEPPTLLRGTSGEAGVLFALLILGGFLIPSGRGRVERLALAVIAGVALHGALGILLVPGWWGPLVTVAAAFALGLLARRRGLAAGWRREDLPSLAGAAALIVGVVAAARASGLLLLTGDSHHYWGGGAALADGTFGVIALDVKRGISQEALHALGFLAGAEGLQALNPVLLVAGLSLVAVASSRKAAVAPIAALVSLSFVASPQVRAITAFLGGHVLVGVLLLALIVLLRDEDDGGSGAADIWLRPAVASLIAALVVTRPEGGALAALILLGASLGGRGSAGRARESIVTAWFDLGIASLFWGGVLAVGAIRFDGDRSAAIDLLLAIGLAALAGGLIHRVAALHIWRALVLAAGATLWAVTFWLLAQDRVRFVDAAVENLGRGEGGWGVLGPMLLITAVVALALTAGSDSADVQAARLLIIGFVPVALLAKLGDGLQVPEEGLERLLSGGGRVGWGDSINRMWMHGVLVVGYLLVRASQVASRFGVVPILALVVLGPWFAFQWQPTHVPIRSELQERLFLEAGGEDAMVELVDGLVVEQALSVDLASLPASSTPRTVCVDVPLATFDRPVGGQIRLDLEQDERVVTRLLDGDRIFDWEEYRICSDLDDASARAPEGLDLVVRLTGVGGVAGAAPGALRADLPLGFGALLTFPAEDGARTQQAEHLALLVSLVVEEPIGLFERPLERVTLVLPWLVLLLGGGAVVSRLRGGI